MDRKHRCQGAEANDGGHDLRSAYLSVELVCSSAGQSAASPPATAPCRRCGQIVEETEGTHSPAATTNVPGCDLCSSKGDTLVFVFLLKILHTVGATTFN